MQLWGRPPSRYWYQLDFPVATSACSAATAAIQQPTTHIATAQVSYGAALNVRSVFKVPGEV